MNDPEQQSRDIYNELKKANDALHEMHSITLVGGAPGGEVFEVPDGVMQITVEDMDGVLYSYVRDSTDESTFVLDSNS